MVDTQPRPPGLLCCLQPRGVGDRTLFWVMWQGSKGCVKQVGPLSDGKMHFYHQGLRDAWKANTSLSCSTLLGGG